MRSLWRRGPSYLLCFAVVSPLVVLWSLATPLMAVSDGPNHIYAAAATVRGEFHQPFVNTPFGKQQSVRVPGQLAGLLHAADCLIQSNAASPNQCRRDAVSDAAVSVPTQFMRYPPLFHLAIGWPTLLVSGTAAYWAVTMSAAVINSALLAVALWSLLRFGRRRMVLFGWLACLTPEVLFLAGSANDSGFEISAAVAAWAGLLAIAMCDRPPRRLVVAATGATCCFALARPASPLWVAIMAVASGIIAGRERLVELAKQLQLRLAAAAVVLSGVLALAWRLYAGSPGLLYVAPPPAHPTWSQATTAALASERTVMQGLVGGFLALPVPLMTLLLWVAGIAVLAVGGLAFAERRFAVVAFGLAALMIAIPILGNVIEFSRLGVWWQSRYGIPFAVGLPLVLGLSIPNRVIPRARRLLLFGLLALGAGEAVCFVWVLHRYAAGVDGSWRRFRWEPPGGVVPLCVLFAVATAAAAVLVWKSVAAPSRDPGSATRLLTASAESDQRRDPRQDDLRLDPDLR